MSTIAKTTASAVGRKLRSLNFEPYDYATGIGCSVWQSGSSVEIANWGFAPGTASQELRNAGFIVLSVDRGNYEHDGKHFEMVTVIGRADA
jgi:hypothetical protein